ncbi:MAG: signal peptidase I [Candidatus Levyibacteriota bacterium]|jgi:signal peptidase I
MEIIRKVYAFLIDGVETLLIAAAIFLVIYAFLFRPFNVDGQSMYPNFHNGEYVITNLIGFEDFKIYHAEFGTLKLGDVVVFIAPPDPTKDYIKRVIGVPGDKIMIKDGSVYLNGKLLDESVYLSSDVKTNEGAFLSEGQTITVPANEYFVLGDNRPESSDSRTWGFVPRDNIVGKSLLVYWPLDRMRLIQNPY